MKILCDVCGEEEASVFCCADEAALCDGCDGRVHRANKLAGKHRRFSLSSPTAQSHPVCDICQEKRGFLFCQQDRAILCKDCDAPIHSANHLTMKHNRYLLTGARLSCAPISSAPSSEAEEAANANSDAPISNPNKPLAAKNTHAAAAAAAVPAAAPPAGATTIKPAAPRVCINQNSNLIAHNNSKSPDTPISTSTSAASSAAAASVAGASSISEYLIKMCPGWHVEDLLVDDATVGLDGFSKVDELLPFLEADLDNGSFDAVPQELPVWAPHVPQFPPAAIPAKTSGTRGASDCVHYQPWTASKEIGFDYQQQSAKPGRERWSEDAFMVPQISPASNPNKRARRSALYY